MLIVKNKHFGGRGGGGGGLIFNIKLHHKMYKTKFCFVRVCVEARTHTITQSTLPITSTAHAHTAPPFLQKSREVQLTRPNRHSLSRTYTLAAHSDQHCFKQTDTVQSFQRVYTVSRISCKKVNEFLNFNDPSTVSCHLGISPGPD